MMIRLIVLRNLGFKVKIIVNPLLKINLLIYQNTSLKEKINIPSKINTIDLNNPRKLINLMKSGRITLKIMKKDDKKEVKMPQINKRKRNQKKGISIRA
jgi:hypothetical protein